MTDKPSEGPFRALGDCIYDNDDFLVADCDCPWPPSEQPDRSMANAAYLALAATHFDAMRDVLREAGKEMVHARLFMRTREKIHPNGLALFDKHRNRIKTLLAAIERDEKGAKPCPTCRDSGYYELEDPNADGEWMRGKCYDCDYWGIREKGAGDGSRKT